MMQDRIPGCGSNTVEGVSALASPQLLEQCIFLSNVNCKCVPLFNSFLKLCSLQFQLAYCKSYEAKQDSRVWQQSGWGCVSTSKPTTPGAVHILEQCQLQMCSPLQQLPETMPKVHVQRSDLSAPLPAAQARGPRLCLPGKKTLPASLWK